MTESRLRLPTDSSSLYLPVISKETGGQEKGSLVYMFTKIVRELNGFRSIRDSKYDLPQEIRYLRNPQDGILIMVSLRRPTTRSYRGDEEVTPSSHLYGYFAEAHQEKNGQPTQTVDDPSVVWRGAYEQVDISDQGNYHDAGLTPTSFTQTKQKVLGAGKKENQLAIEGGQNQNQETQRQIIEQSRLDQTSSALTTAQDGVVAKLFSLANDQSNVMNKKAVEVREAIAEKFISSIQGLTSEVGLANLIISDKLEEPPLSDLSSNYGLIPYVIPFWQMVKNVDPYVRHVIRKGGAASEKFPLDQIEDLTNFNSDTIRKFKENTGFFPLIITLNTRNLASAVREEEILNSRLELLTSLFEESREHPLFAIIELGEAEKEEGPNIKRESAGRYLFQAENIEEIRGLLLKIGVDYALTKQVRGLAELANAL